MTTSTIPTIRHYSNNPFTRCCKKIVSFGKHEFSMTRIKSLILEGNNKWRGPIHFVQSYFTKAGNDSNSQYFAKPKQPEDTPNRGNNTNTIPRNFENALGKKTEAEKLAAILTNLNLLITNLGGISCAPRVKIKFKADGNNISSFTIKITTWDNDNPDSGDILYRYEASTHNKLTNQYFRNICSPYQAYNSVENRTTTAFSDSDGKFKFVTSILIL